MRKRTWLAAIVCAVSLTAGSLHAQNFPMFPGIPGMPGGSGDPLQAEVPDVTVEPNTTFDIQVLITDPNPIQGCIAQLTTNLQLLSGAPGAAMAAYTDANGEPPACDVTIGTGGGIGMVTSEGTGFFVFGAPFESGLYGTELIVYTAVAPSTPGTYTVDFAVQDVFGMAPATVGQATITVSDPSIEPPKELVRGDINDDGSCNIADPVMLLTHLFDGGAAPNCFDSADVDDDGSVNLSDVINLLSGVFGTGFEMDETCKADTTVDSLGDCERANCQ